MNQLNIRVFRREPLYESPGLDLLMGTKYLWEAVIYHEGRSYHGVDYSPEKAITQVIRHMRGEGLFLPVALDLERR